MENRNEIFQRTALLLGDEFMQRVAEKRVILFGVGGVGSWCAEMLIRSGILHLTIVDSDRVSITNVNRQLMATTQTVGQVKVEVLKQRLLEINPDAEIVALQQIYSSETYELFGLDTFDFIIDAIDSLSNKIHLIQQACNTDAQFFSSMGAALKTDPTRIRIAEFWKVAGCPLAAAIRSRLRKLGGVDKKFMCVYSDELLENKGNLPDDEFTANQKENSAEKSSWDSKKARINGTSAYMPAMFGMTIASLVVRAIQSEE